MNLSSKKNVLLFLKIKNKVGMVFPKTTAPRPPKPKIAAITIKSTLPKSKLYLTLRCSSLQT